MTVRQQRPAARTLLIDPTGRVLLFRFTPDDRPPFWVTPGGAVDPGETYAQAARRELLEETGLDRDPGPEVARREVEFLTLEGCEVHADERFFVVRCGVVTISSANHTELERRVMTGWRWFTREAIRAHDEPIYPLDLLAMLDIVADVATEDR